MFHSKYINVHIIYAQRQKHSYMYRNHSAENVAIQNLMWLSYTKLRITAGQQTISNQVCNHFSEIWKDIWWYDLKFTVLVSCSNICIAPVLLHASIIAIHCPLPLQNLITYCAACSLHMIIHTLQIWHYHCSIISNIEWYPLHHGTNNAS